MDGQLLLGTLVIVAAVIFHVTCLVHLEKWLKPFKLRLKKSQNILGLITLIGCTIFVVIGIHTIEAGGWAVIYYALDEFTNFNDALYFSVVTSTTLGFGDITLSSEWQLLSAFEAMGGLLLFGFSTAFLIGLLQSLLFQEAE